MRQRILPQSFQAFQGSATDHLVWVFELHLKRMRDFGLVEFCQQLHEMNFDERGKFTLDDMHWFVTIGGRI